MTSIRTQSLIHDWEIKRKHLDNAIIRLEVEGEKATKAFNELDKIWNEVKADTGYHLVNRWRE